MNKIDQYLLEKNKCDFETLALPPNVGMEVPAHAAALGISEAVCIPGIVFSADKKLVVVYKRYPDKMNTKLLKKKLGVKDLRVATTEELQSLGYEPGLVPLVQTQILSYVDAQVVKLKYLYGGVGSNEATLKIAAQDFLKVTNATVIDITSQSDNHTVLSGIRATGRLHLGNYLGAVKGMLELQNDPTYETFYMVADLHTITTPYEVEALRQNRREVVLDYLAAGLDPEKSVIFLQSMVPQHAELAFYFSSVISIARMQHLPTFKDKVKQYPDHATMALLNYPILMAGDILVYKGGLVPVGVDQEPHLEVAREIARKMNEQYGTDFPEPQRFATKGEYVPSLKGDGKMSKSVEGSFINLTDDLATIAKKVSTIPTDSGKGEFHLGMLKSGMQPKDVPRVPVDSVTGVTSNGVKNLFEFVELFQGTEKRAEYEHAYRTTGLRYGDLKKELAQAIFTELEPLQNKRRELESQPDYVDQVIAEGAAKAQARAEQTMQEVKQKMGLG